MLLAVNFFESRKFVTAAFDTTIYLLNFSGTINAKSRNDWALAMRRPGCRRGFGPPFIRDVQPCEVLARPASAILEPRYGRAEEHTGFTEACSALARRALTGVGRGNRSH